MVTIHALPCNCAVLLSKLTVFYRTVGGSPIVDGKYLDLDTNQVKEIQPRESVGFGPPTIDIYWHNISLSGGSTQFRGFRGVFVYGNVGLYIARLGLFFGKTGGSCELYSLNATPYTVTVIVMTERTYHEIKEQYYDCGLGGPRPTRRTVPGMCTYSEASVLIWYLYVNITDEPSSAPQNQSNSQTGVSQDQ